jgi:hypothetical protein
MYSVPRPIASRLFHVDQWMPCTQEDGPQVIWNLDDRSIQQTSILPWYTHGSTTTVCRVGALTVTAAGRALADAAGAAHDHARPDTSRAISASNLIRAPDIL